MLICPGCGKRELGKATHCSACGSVLPFKTILEMPSFADVAGAGRSCASCAQPVPALASRCPVCGAVQKVNPNDIPTEVEKIDRSGLSSVATNRNPDLATESEPQLGDFENQSVITADHRPPATTPTAQIRAVFASSPAEGQAAQPSQASSASTQTRIDKTGKSSPSELSTLVHRPELEVTIPPLASTVPEMRAAPAVPAPAPPSPQPNEARQRLDAATRAVARSSGKARVATPAIPTTAESQKPGSVAGVQVELRPKNRRPSATAPATAPAPAAPPAPPRVSADTRHEMPTRVYPAMQGQPAAPTPPDRGLQGAPTVDMEAAQQPSPAATVAPCGHCGTARLPNMKFCHECGSPLTLAPPSPTSASVRSLASPASLTTAADELPCLRALSGGQLGEQRYAIRPSGLVLGRAQATVQIPGDPYLSSPHLRCSRHGQGVLIEDLGSRNGVFVRLRRPQKIDSGARFVLGSQLFVFFDDDSAREAVLPIDDGRGTRLIASPGSGQPLTLVQIFDGGACSIYRRQQRAITLGRRHCDFNFPGDPEVSEKHLRLIRAGDSTVIEDLGSRNGTFVAITQPTAIEHGDEIIVGSQILRCICH